jgi:hypothetical protein
MIPELPMEILSPDTEWEARLLWSSALSELPVLTTTGLVHHQFKLGGTWHEVLETGKVKAVLSCDSLGIRTNALDIQTPRDVVVEGEFILIDGDLQIRWGIIHNHPRIILKSHASGMAFVGAYGAHAVQFMAEIEA